VQNKMNFRITLAALVLVLGLASANIAAATRADEQAATFRATATAAATDPPTNTTDSQHKSLSDCSGDKSIIDAYKEAYTRQHLDMTQLQSMINAYNSQCGVLTGWE
jgi:hypothetical protein